MTPGLPFWLSTVDHWLETIDYRLLTGLMGSCLSCWVPLCTEPKSPSTRAVNINSPTYLFLCIGGILTIYKRFWDWTFMKFPFQTFNVGVVAWFNPNVYWECILWQQRTTQQSVQHFVELLLIAKREGMWSDSEKWGFSVKSIKFRWKVLPQEEGILSGGHPRRQPKDP